MPFWSPVKHPHRGVHPGCRFTLAAVEHSDKAEAHRAQALLRRHGGRRFTSQTLHLLQGVDKALILALCPCSLTNHKITQLQAWTDFTSGMLAAVAKIAAACCCCCCFAAAVLLRLLMLLLLLLEENRGLTAS